MNRSRFDPRHATISHYTGRVPVFAAAWGPVLEGLAAPLFAELAGRAPGRTLDLGCGVGGATDRLPPATISIGVDHFREMLLAARARHPGLIPVLADAAGLPFGDRSFDLVFAGFMLHHVREQWRALGEAHRVLSPGGALALATWGKQDAGSPAFELFEALLHQFGAPGEDPAPPPVWLEALASVDALERLTGSLGFRPLRIWSARPAWNWDRTRLLEYLSGLGGTARRLEQLPVGQRERCLERAAAGFAELEPGAFVWRPEVLFALVERTPVEGA